MKTLSLLTCLAALVLLSSGCNLFRKSKKPKDNPAIATEVEADFRQRWVDRRVAELTQQGTDASTALTQANAEFRQQYPYVKQPKQPAQ